MEEQTIPQITAGETPAPEAPQEKAQEMTAEQKRQFIVIGIVAVLLVVGLIAGIVFLAVTDDLTIVTRVRDIFIIFMALESLLIGLALVILMVQLARLINLLENEVKPILDSTNETVNHLRGTTQFLGDNLVQPVIKLNEYLAGFAQLLQVIGLARKPSKSNPKPPKGE